VNFPVAPVDRIDRHELVRALKASDTIGDQAELVDLTYHPIGIGHTADTLRVELRWARPSDGPATIVAKLPSTDEQSAQTAASLGAYEREARFYAELAPRTALSLPVFHGVMHYDGQPSGLLLEDLTDFEIPDQLSEAPAPMLRHLREELAALQAPFWDDGDMAATPWLHRRLGVPIPDILERMARSWAATRGYLTAGFDAEERAVIDRFVRRAGAWAESLDGPFSLTHHDFRLDNMLFGDGRVVVLDWQTVGWGVPMFDVAYLLGTSVGPEARRTLEKDEIARHVDDLAIAGVPWSFDEAWEAYRQASFAVLLMLVPPTGSVKRTERGDAMFHRLLRQGARMALDLRADEFLPVGAA
jgi:hypothetical protein